MSNQRETSSLSGKAVNLILRGPPGTGKSRWLREKAAEYTDASKGIGQETWPDDLLAGFGWRAVIAATLASFGRAVELPELGRHPWIDARARRYGTATMALPATLSGYLEQHTPEPIPPTGTRRPPFIFSLQEGGAWQLHPAWEELDKEAAELVQSLRAGPERNPDPACRHRFATFYPSLTHEEFAGGVFKRICEEARVDSLNRYALLIDQMECADAARLFGGLITLIEPDHRARFDTAGRLVGGWTGELPGAGKEPFGVPANLDLFGAITTGIRPVTPLGTALLRRFEIREVEPGYSLIDRSIGTVHLGRLLKRLNDRIAYLLDGDHRIGHGYFIPVTSLAELRRLFGTRIIPLLQEAFHHDMARVAMVLETGSTGSAFIAGETVSYSTLFQGALPEGIPEKRSGYGITPSATWLEDDFHALQANLT
ncbi:MAG: hypothetical protein V4710_07005 [Verrucomicrobiota bacterium]